MEDCNRPVSHWSAEERLAWGRAEAALRKQELAMVKDETLLRAVQARAKKRRNAVGASSGQAFSMLRDAQIEDDRLARVAAQEAAKK